jgi:hypothetical protein
MVLVRHYLCLYVYILRLNFFIQYFLLPSIKVEAAFKVYIETGKTCALLPPSMIGNSFRSKYTEAGYQNYFSEFTRVLDYQFFKNAPDYIEPELKLFILQIYDPRPYFISCSPISLAVVTNESNIYLFIGFKYR